MAGQEANNANWLLDQAQEDALHATRLLQVEERPFQRVTKSILGKDSFLRTNLQSLPSPPPEDDADAESEQPPSDLYSPSKAQKFHNEVLLDFSNLESSITRIQLILSSNERERARYAAEKARILSTAQAVRENTSDLRVHLTEAQRILELRKGYDELAGKILDDKKLKSRDECRAEIERLEKEIEDLKSEGSDYEVTWLSRREQFDRMVDEGEAMVRLIKGTTEPEKDEEGAEEDGEADMDSPAPDGRSPRPMETGGDATPMPLGSGEGGGATPARPANRFLEVDDVTRTASQAASPVVQPVGDEGDVEMVESITVPETGEQVADLSEGLEAEPEQVEESAMVAPDSMDES